MLNQARKYEKRYRNYKTFKAKINDELPFNEEFDHVFLSFVFHGFENEDKEKILKNAYKSLKYGGYLNILDYSEFDLNKAIFLIKIFFNKFECELAKEFINLNLSSFVKPFGFEKLEEHLLNSKYIRLFIARKI
jgi:ubiquinone/menaquinone biosynthesis C-methylase UbiE